MSLIWKGSLDVKGVFGSGRAFHFKMVFGSESGLLFQKYLFLWKGSLEVKEIFRLKKVFGTVKGVF